MPNEKRCFACDSLLPDGSHGRRKYCGRRHPAVYRFVCPDGRSYVGSTINYPDRGWIGVSRDNPRLREAYATYPPKTWVYEVLEKLPTDCHANALRLAEQQHIERLRSWLPENGFNVNEAALAMFTAKERHMRLSKRGTLNWATSIHIAMPDQWPMSTEEFQKLCAKSDITNSKIAAELFGLSPRTCQRYWYGELDVPGPLARLLRLAVKYHCTHDDLRGIVPRHKAKAKL